MTFANRLKDLREENKLTQAELAQKFNITSQTISQYERGIRTPDFALLNSIADYFGVSVDYLLGRTNIRNYEENTIAAHTDDRTQQLSEEGRKKLDDFIDYLIFEEMKRKMTKFEQLLDLAEKKILLLNSLMKSQNIVLKLYMLLDMVLE